MYLPGYFGVLFALLSCIPERDGGEPASGCRFPASSTRSPVRVAGNKPTVQRLLNGERSSANLRVLSADSCEPVRDGFGRKKHLCTPDPHRPPSRAALLLPPPVLSKIAFTRMVGQSKKTEEELMKAHFQGRPICRGERRRRLPVCVTRRGAVCVPYMHDSRPGSSPVPSTDRAKS